MGGITPPKFNMSPLENNGWNTSFLLGWPIFRGYVKLPGSTGKFCEKMWGWGRGNLGWTGMNQFYFNFGWQLLCRNFRGNNRRFRGFWMVLTPYYCYLPFVIGIVKSPNGILGWLSSFSTGFAMDGTKLRQHVAFTTADFKGPPCHSKKNHEFNMKPISSKVSWHFFFGPHFFLLGGGNDSTPVLHITHLQIVANLRKP